MSFIRWSILQSAHSFGCGSYFSSLSRMAISVTTSLRLYSMNSFHRAGSCCGRFRVRPPLAFVGRHGLQKYWIRLLPTGSFSLSSGRPRAAPAAASDAGSPHSRARIMVSSHCSGGISLWSHAESAERSKIEFHAVLIMFLSFSIPKKSASCSPCPAGSVMSITVTGPLSRLYPINKISKSGSSTYL